MAKTTKTAAKSVKKTTKAAKSKAKKTFDAAETQGLKITQIARKGALAYVGLHVAAYDRVKPAFTGLSTKTDGLFNELVEKGEGIEAQAQSVAAVAASKVVTTFGKVRASIPAMPKMAANDRVAELEAELEALNKKVATMAKKKTSKPVRVTTEKTVKVA